MSKNKHILTVVLSVLFTTLPVIASEKKGDKPVKVEGEITENLPKVFWTNPTDVSTRNLFYGPGGKEHEPHSTYTFDKEDTEGTNPKFSVKDENGVEWKVKLGAEARPETVATRLVWAVGYLADEDYFLPVLRVEGMPAHLHRGQNQIQADGTLHNVRLERKLKGEKKIGTWEWKHDPFTGTREYNGLRVLMAVINNWDLKDVNNAIYQEKRDDSSQELRYVISDLGASFGTASYVVSHEKAKGNLESYTHSKFITKTGTEYVDFQNPGRPTLISIFNPHEFFSREHMRWIGKQIPREHAKWMGEQLAQLSADQIRDAFRAAGYTQEEVEGFSKVLERRIAELKAL